ncbi:MAG TPA: cupin-like domain-containing protein [Kofleriaceae bacterium]|nr:cupin-like domain-containing protein [Kofleriaceae bacterium]
MQSPQAHIHANLHDIIRTLLPSIAGARPQTVVQFTVRDKRVSAFVVVDRSAPRETVHVRDGKHASPDASFSLSTHDLRDIAGLGCVRGPVSMTGNPDVLSSFRDRFMSISPEGKARVEEITSGPLDGEPGSEIEHIRADSLSAAEFLQRYAVASRPVVLTDAMPRWKASPWTPDRIRTQLGDTSVNVRAGNYAADIYQQTMQSREVRLADYLDAVEKSRAPADGTEAPPPYAASNGVPWDWHLWLDHPPFVPEALCGFAKYWIGPAGTATPLHRDWLDNFLTQVVGTKRLGLVAPGRASRMSPRTIHTGLDSCNWVDPFDPEDALAAQCDPRFVTLNAGEMLFLPAGWFHDVRSTSFSFSVNFFLMRVPYAVCPP